mgnify:CR=1 FL=1
MEYYMENKEYKTKLAYWKLAVNRNSQVFPHCLRMLRVPEREDKVNNASYSSLLHQ